MVLRARRRRSTVEPDDLAVRRRRPRRGARAVRLPRVPHAVRPARRGASAPSSAAPSSPATRRARGRGRPASSAGDAAAAAARRAAPTAAEPLAVAAAWAGAEGARALDGLALVVDGDAGDGGVAARPRCSTTPTVARRARRAGRRRRPTARRPRRQAARCGRCSAARHRRAHAGARHDARGLPARSGRVALPARRAARCATPTSRCPRPSAAPPRASSTSTATAVPTLRRPARAGAGRRRSSQPLLGRARRAGPARAARRHRGPARAACWPAWRTSASASTSAELRAPQRPARPPSATQLHAADLGRRRARSSTSTPRRSCAQILFDELGLHAAEEDQDRLLHRRRVAREAGRPAPDHRAPAAVPRGREAALDLRRGPAGRGRAPTAASTPRSTRPSPAPAGSARTRRTCTTSRCAASEGREFRRAFVAGAGLRAARRRLQPDRAALHRPPRRGPGPRSPRSSRRRHPHRHRGAGVRRRARRRSRSTQRSKAKMVSYGLAYGMEAYGLGQRLNIPTDEAAEILDAYFVAFPSVKAYMERTVAEARERGYTETLFGRRRPIPELSSSQLPHPPGRRAPGHERRHPGPGRRHLQGRARAPRPRARGPGARRAGSSCRCTTRCCSRCRPTSTTRRPSSPSSHGAAALGVPLAVNLCLGRSWAAAKL